MADTRDRPSRLSPALLHQIDRRCDAFEAALRAGMAPRLEDYLAGFDEPAHAILLRELQLLEQANREGMLDAAEARSADFADQHAYPASEFPAEAAGLAAEDAGRHPRTRFGDYELIEKVGQGGMGEVFRALQLSAQRVVALKIIRRDRLAELPEARRFEWVQRFKKEAHAAAHIEHENVVPVYEVGEIDGRHFYSMRYVVGRNLADLSDNMPSRRAAEIIAALARAVQHAHERGVLHRDLKPRNILLDAAGRPHIVDFGLAKWLLGEAEQTASGALLGSPPYMAPEQVNQAGAVTVATDVYGLGATLYHLIAGRPPFPIGGSASVFEQVLNEQPLAPSGLRPGIDRDLETICLKCLEKEPGHRYRSAAELADDLARFLDGETIRARRAGPTERARKWARRHPLRVALTAVSGAFVLAAIVGGLVYVTQLDQERRRTQSKSDRAVQFGRDAVAGMQERFDDLQAEWGQHFPGVSESVWRDQLTRIDAIDSKLSQAALADPEILLIRAGLGRLKADAEGLLGKVEEALNGYDQALARYDRLPADDADVRHDRAACLHNRGMLQSQRERLGDAERSLRQALEIRQGLAAERAGAGIQGDLAATHYALGALYARTAKHKDAAFHYAEAERRQEELVKQYPESLRFGQDLARTLNNEGILTWKRGDLKAARSAFERSVALQDGIVTRSPSIYAFARLRARAQYNLASVLAALGENERAKEYYQKAVTCFEHGHHLYPQIPDYAQELAAAFLAVAAFKEAIEEAGEDTTRAIARMYQAALRLREKLVANYPGVDQYQGKLALARKAYAYFLLSRGQFQEAEALLRSALKAQAALCARLPDVPDYRDDLANLQNSLARAIQALALEPQDAAAAVGSPRLLPALLAVRQGKLLAALQTLDQARAGHEALCRQNPHNAHYRRNLALDCYRAAGLYADLGEHARAAASARSYRELARPADAEELVQAAALWCNFAARLRSDTAARHGYESEAIACLRQALAHGAGPAALRRSVFDPIRARPEFEKLQTAGAQ